MCFILRVLSVLSVVGAFHSPTIYVNKSSQRRSASRSQRGNIIFWSSSSPGTHRSIQATLSATSFQDMTASTASTTTSKTLDWSFLDGVYLITCPNADPNGERLTRAQAILESVGLSKDIVEIKEFDTDDENRIRGCYTSHISVLSDVLESTRSADKNIFEGILDTLLSKSNRAAKTKDTGNLNVLVLEDNLALSSSNLKQSLLNSVSEYMTKTDAWDIIHLSYIPYVPDLTLSRTENKDIVKLSCGIGSALGTTAYIINTKAMERLLRDDKENDGFYLPIPDVMAKLFPETRYASAPTMFVRAPTTKSLVNPQLDDLREILFQPSVASFSQQLLISTGLTTNLLLPVIVVILLGASVLSLTSTFQSFLTVATTGEFDGPIIFPLLSGAFSLFSLAILAKGAMLAPKQE